MKAIEITAHQKSLESKLIQVNHLARDEYRNGPRDAQTEFDSAWLHIERLKNKGIVGAEQAMKMFDIFRQAMNPAFDEKEYDDAYQHPLVQRLRAEFRYVRLWHSLGLLGKKKKSSEAHVYIEA